MKSLFSSLSTTDLTFYRSDSNQKLPLFNQCKPADPSLLKNPYPITKVLKFPKNKHVRRQTQINMLTQSLEKQRKPSIKYFLKRNQSSLDLGGESLEKYQRKRNAGRYYKWSQQTNDENKQQVPKAKNDWVCENRRALAGRNYGNPNPILIGQVHKETRSYLQKIEKQPRRHRDNGQRMKQRFIWQKEKPKTYLQKFRATKGLKTQAQ